MMAACVTASLLACGMAKPPIMPVVPSASRALKASQSASASVAMPKETACSERSLRTSSTVEAEQPRTT